tara:strand:+ start:6471 stop:7076 length:606 start_codon:yes stop_codon:yes gene_type:complete
MPATLSTADDAPKKATRRRRALAPPPKPKFLYAIQQRVKKQKMTRDQTTEYVVRYLATQWPGIQFCRVRGRYYYCHTNWRTRYLDRKVQRFYHVFDVPSGAWWDAELQQVTRAAAETRRTIPAKKSVVKIQSKVSKDDDKNARLLSAAVGLLGLRAGFSRHPNKHTPSSGGVKLSTAEADDHSMPADLDASAEPWRCSEEP